MKIFSLFNAVPTWDVLLVFFFLASGFFYGLFFGRARLLALVVGIYVGITFREAISLFDITKDSDMISAIQISAFILSACAAYGIIYSSFLRGRRLGDERWWQIFLLSFLMMGLVASAIVRLLPLDTQSIFTEAIRRIFISNEAYTAWLTLPLLAVLFASRRVE
ncbi:MAG: Uncharacterized protein G01um101429_235 [Parcubacteria group bacterium Gr01-1014_29]|nr:MAG: Uncharacterized protein G01um101429_235 [Parcubacteria group bacterium Gr01-1014_29]